MKTSPIVSVIIPTHNRPQELLGAVKSVLDQTFQDIEIIVVDDTSPVPAAETLKDCHDPRLKITKHNVNKGVSEARNTGIKMAQGEWIAFLDDDDAWRPQKLERQLAFMKNAAPDADASATDVYNTATKIHRKYSENVRRKGINRAILYWEGFLPSTWLINRAAFAKTGLFDPHLHRTEDWEWLLRYYIQGLKFVIVPEDLVLYSGWHTPDPFMEVECIRQVVGKHRDQLKKTAGPARACFIEIYLHQRIARAYVGKKGNLKTLKHFIIAFAYLIKAMALSPADAFRFIAETIRNNYKNTARLKSFFRKLYHARQR